MKTQSFFLGTHQPAWLASAGVPLFVSRRRLAGRSTLPRAAAPWALDSGGFTELSMFGRWTVDARTYAAEVRRFSDEIGALEWAAPQDWMCEPAILAKTGETVETHQRRTIANARKNPALPGHGHKSCSNCLEFALAWRSDVIDSMAVPS